MRRPVKGSPVDFAASGADAVATTGPLLGAGSRRETAPGPVCPRDGSGQRVIG
ncbi:hypothetical protein [Asanoa ferruginea]|uniref:hypothetical protein n=1 Tax=Asanoa ferruginea TaxID=53367 RepID=UPI001476FD12|nr:hypothetical protein [Asanoa ferruginea]